MRALQSEDASFYATTMFVRFRRQARRLQVSLVQNRRVAGKVRAEHIGALGSVDADVSVRGRLAFWAKLPQRLAALGNRVGPNEHARIYAALHARIPMVTPDEQRGVQEENASDDERFWDAMQGLSAATAEDHKRLIASAEAKLKESEHAAADAAKNREIARERLAKLKRGESVAGGLGKKLDIVAMMKAAFTPREIRRMVLYASLTREDFEAMLDRTGGKSIDAVDRIGEREARRILRARNATPR
jgi:hypothetical protein